MPTSTAKKVVAKKLVAKKAPVAKKKGAALRTLVLSPEHESFWVTDGQILNSLHSLASALEAMSNDVYTYHVTKERNDFADWVAAVLNDDACATDLRKAKSPKTACTVVVRHLKFYA